MREENSDLRVTPSILAEIPRCLEEYLVMLKGMQQYQRGPKPIRLSNKALASRFIFLRWDIEFSRDHEDLFSSIVREYHNVMLKYLERGNIDTDDGKDQHSFEIGEVSQCEDILVLEFKLTD